MPPENFFDLAPVHILTTATINRLRELYQKGRFEVRRFRPNIVVEVTRLKQASWTILGLGIRCLLAMDCA
jgi:uncharacterized protein YcbX